MSHSDSVQSARTEHRTDHHTRGDFPSRTEHIPAIETRGLTKTYGDVTAVDGLDLVVEPGEIFGFLGPNGAGKSTTINMLLGFLEPSSGNAAILGSDAQAESLDVRNQIGVLPEGYGLYDRLPGRKHLEFAIEWKDARTSCDSVLTRVGLDRDDADRPVGEYSKGMQQRLALGMALVGDPALLILDEPTSGLDPHGIKRMRRLLQEEAEKGTTVFFSSHILGEVEAVCDRVGILNDGNLVAVDTVSGLREAAGAGSELRLRVDDRPTINLTSIPGVEDVAFHDGYISITCREPRAKAKVITRLSAAGTEVVDVGSTDASLEDVFTAYTTGGDSSGDPQTNGSGRSLEVSS